ncbi:hypothetical protein [Nocardia sp. NPDC005366]|uniref:hypothetical protein n=1 Tax=Nocardia sp. NPDC005366 TaxID=3156878 RepID=UPI0033A7CB82
MSEQTTVQHSTDPTAQAAASDSDTTPARSEALLAWSLAAGAAVTVPVGGGQLILMSKPIGGVIGAPGAVSGYIAVTAALLGCLTALAAPRLLRRTSAHAGAWSALGAGAALIVAAAATGPILFCAGVLVAGALTGVVYTTGRIYFAELGANARNSRHAMTWLGLLTSAALARIFYTDPMSGLMAAGVVAAGFGVLAVPLAMNPGPARSVTGPVAPHRPALLGYGAAGFAVGATITPTLHLLLLRWEVLGEDQMPIVGVAAVAALVAVLVPLRPVSVSLLLVIAAGGPLLASVGPGSATTAVGLAVTVAATARAVVELDRSAAHATARPTAIAVCVGGLGAVAGYGTGESLAEVFSAGTALTLVAVPILAITAVSTIAASKPRHSTAVSEGDHS